MNSRWSIEEEKMLINDVKNNKSFQELALKYNRSPNALELRIKKIVYDNIAANKSPAMIGGHLNLPQDKIMQYYYAYKEMLEKRGKINNEILNGGNGDNSNRVIQVNKEANLVKQINQVIKNNKISQNKQNGGDNRDENKLNNIKQQNEVFDEILKNVKLRHKLLKLLKDNKLDTNIKLLLKDILKD
jgi:hypothetical protein